MNFAKFYYKLNSSTQSLQGNILKSTIEQIHQDKVIINTGLRTSFLCFQHELGFQHSISKSNDSLPVSVVELKPAVPSSHRSSKEQNKTALKQRTFFDSYHYDKININSEAQTKFFSLEKARSVSGSEKKQDSDCVFSKKMIQPDSNFCLIGVNLLEKQSKRSGEFVCSSPKSSLRITKRTLIWTELNKCRCESHKKNRINGFILNPVNGGFAVAVAGYIAFLPRSLCFNKKVFIGQWRQFSIISMNSKLANIVLKEIKTNTFSVLTEKKAKKNTEKERKNAHYANILKV